MQVHSLFRLLAHVQYQYQKSSKNNKQGILILLCFIPPLAILCPRATSVDHFAEFKATGKLSSLRFRKDFDALVFAVAFEF